MANLDQHDILLLHWWRRTPFTELARIVSAFPECDPNVDRDWVTSSNLRARYLRPRHRPHWQETMTT
ncbi:hypothetical protein HYQ46_002480 [Verticillium longisporum]|nr:hypothetical protein HYQ46_002480 [Verticillium longisporum]